MICAVIYTDTWHLHVCSNERWSYLPLVPPGKPEQSFCLMCPGGLESWWVCSFRPVLKMLNEMGKSTPPPIPPASESEGTIESHAHTHQHHVQSVCGQMWWGVDRRKPKGRQEGDATCSKISLQSRDVVGTRKKNNPPAGLSSAHPFLLKIHTKTSFYSWF